MKTRNWNVGLLKEIHPIHDSSILGFNKNKRQVIALRLRTNDMDGFRNYADSTSTPPTTIHTQNSICTNHKHR